MSKKSKIIIALGVIGLVLICVGAVLGGSLTSLPTIFSEVTLPEGAVAQEEINAEDVNSIEINLLNSDITIQSGDVFRFSGTGLHGYYVKDGVLYAGATEAKHAAKVFGAKVPVPGKWIYGHGTYVLTIPEHAELESIKINASHCNITGKSLVAKSIELTTDSGDITLEKIAADTLNMSVASLTVTDIQALQNAEITASKDVIIGNDTLMENVLQNFNLTSSRGDITAFGKLMGNCQLAAKRGKVSATLAGASTNYTMRPLAGELSVGTETGAEVSEEHFGDISFSSKQQSDVHFK